MQLFLLAFLAIFAGTDAINVVGKNFIFAMPRDFDSVTLPYIVVTNGLSTSTDVIVESACFPSSYSFTVAGQNTYRQEFPKTCQTTYNVNLGAGGYQENLGIRIASTQNISVIAVMENIDTINNQDVGGSTGSYIVFPLTSIGDSYYAVTGLATNNQNWPAQDTLNQFTIVANEPQTQVLIYQGAVLRVSVTLDVLQTYTYVQEYDMTGYFIQSSHPVAVISGSRSTSDGTNFPNLINMISVMLIPTNSYGTTFSISQLTPNNEGDWIRVIASADNTVVKYKNVQKATLQQGQFCRFAIPSADKGSLTTTNPALVIQEMQAASSQYSAPSFVIVPASTTEGNLALYTTPGLLHFQNYQWTHYILVITDSTSTNKLSLDGGAVNGWSQIPGTSQYATHVQVVEGTHQITMSPSDLAAGVTFTAIAYGYSYTTSYCFVASITLVEDNPNIPCPQPCLNGGVCSGTGRCLCPTGWYGPQCQDTTPCTSTTCLNGGSCVRIDNTNYVCECINGWYGPNCQYINPCQPDSCQNGGTCSRLNNTAFQCTCPACTSGTFCGTVDPCCANNNPCANGGTCGRVTNTQYQCNCPTDYSGNNCQNFNPCQPDSCHNGGTCTRLSNTNFECTCPACSSGTFCETVDPCCANNNPCANGGTCGRVTNTQYQCDCPTGYSGNNCQNFNPCYSSPCGSGGTCVQLDSVTYTCVCPDGFMGPNCGNADPCTSNPCQNDGICTATTAGYTCICLGPFQGVNCQTAITTQPPTTTKLPTTPATTKLPTTPPTTAKLPTTRPTPRQTQTPVTQPVTNSVPPPSNRTCNENAVKTTCPPYFQCAGLANRNYADPACLCASYFFTCSNGYCYKMNCPDDVYGVQLYYDEPADKCLYRQGVPGC